MTLEQIKTEIRELYKERNELFRKRSYYKKKLENYKNLQDRSECPCCEQKTNREYFKNEIPIIEEILQKLLNNIETIVLKTLELEKPIRIDNENKIEEHKKQINIYIHKNKNIMNKTIRDYNKGIENHLPNIIESEKELWNEAMEHHLDNKNMVENDELYFEIKNKKRE